MYGLRIKELRLEIGLTQKQLAEKVGTTQMQISKYEKEALDLNTEMLMRFAKFFGVSTDYLLGLED